MNRATWYFDFVSPFAYLHHLSLDEFSEQLFIDRKPLLFAGLLKHWGTKGPAELLSKRIFTYRYIQWYANSLNIPFRFPERHPFNPIPLLSLCIVKGCSKDAGDSIFIDAPELKTDTKNDETNKQSGGRVETTFR